MPHILEVVSGALTWLGIGSIPIERFAVVGKLFCAVVTRDDRIWQRYLRSCSRRHRWPDGCARSVAGAFPTVLHILVKCIQRHAGVADQDPIRFQGGCRLTQCCTCIKQTRGNGWQRFVKSFHRRFRFNINMGRTSIGHDGCEQLASHPSRVVSTRQLPASDRTSTARSSCCR
mgnify:CR=1 FL=1